MLPFFPDLVNSGNDFVGNLPGVLDVLNHRDPDFPGAASKHLIFFPPDQGLVRMVIPDSVKPGVNIGEYLADIIRKGEQGIPAAGSWSAARLDKLDFITGNKSVHSSNCNMGLYASSTGKGR